MNLFTLMTASSGMRAFLSICELKLQRVNVQMYLVVPMIDCRGKNNTDLLISDANKSVISPAVCKTLSEQLLTFSKWRQQVDVNSFSNLMAGQHKTLLFSGLFALHTLVSVLC